MDTDVPGEEEIEEGSMETEDGEVEEGEVEDGEIQSKEDGEMMMVDATEDGEKAQEAGIAVETAAAAVVATTATGVVDVKSARGEPRCNGGGGGGGDDDDGQAKPLKREGKRNREHDEDGEVAEEEEGEVKGQEDGQLLVGNGGGAGGGGGDAGLLLAKVTEKPSQTDGKHEGVAGKKREGGEEDSRSGGTGGKGGGREKGCCVVGRGVAPFVVPSGETLCPIPSGPRKGVVMLGFDCEFVSAPYL